MSGNNRQRSRQATTGSRNLQAGQFFSKRVVGLALCLAVALALSSSVLGKDRVDSVDPEVTEEPMTPEQQEAAFMEQDRRAYDDLVKGEDKTLIRNKYAPYKTRMGGQLKRQDYQALLKNEDKRKFRKKYTTYKSRMGKQLKPDDYETLVANEDKTQMREKYEVYKTWMASQPTPEMPPVPDPKSESPE